jgi:hypothetical protein
MGTKEAKQATREKGASRDQPASSSLKKEKESSQRMGINSSLRGKYMLVITDSSAVFQLCDLMKVI